METNNGAKMMVTLTVDELEAVIERAVKRALANQPEPKLQFNLREAAQMLGWKESLLAERCRSGKVKFHRDGHKYYFTREDLDKIIAASANESGKQGRKTERKSLNSPAI